MVRGCDSAIVERVHHERPVISTFSDGLISGLSHHLRRDRCFHAAHDDHRRMVLASNSRTGLPGARKEMGQGGRDFVCYRCSIGNRALVRTWTSVAAIYGAGRLGRGHAVLFGGFCIFYGSNFSRHLSVRVGQNTGVHPPVFRRDCRGQWGRLHGVRDFCERLDEHAFRFQARERGVHASRTAQSHVESSRYPRGRAHAACGILCGRIRGCRRPQLAAATTRQEPVR